MARRHLLTTIPTPDALSAHAGLLRQEMRFYRAKHRAEDEAYVWWGMERSDSVPQEELLGIETETERNDPGPETHLYLTDYANLYVAHLGGVTKTDPRSTRAGEERTPGSHYKPHHKKWREPTLWFKLWDIRRLASDVFMVNQELKKLRDARHQSREVRIFEGIGEFPIFVTADREPRYFDVGYRNRYADGKHWIELEGERTGIGTIEQDLRANLFGDSVWLELGPSERMFISTAEKIYREHPSDPLFDFSTVFVEYCKAVEVRCMRLLRNAFAQAPHLARCNLADGSVRDITKKDSYLGLSELAKFIELRRSHLRETMNNGTWFTKDFTTVLKRMAADRNPVAHRQVMSGTKVAEWRSELCGIGCKGVFVELADSQPKHRS